MVVSDGLDDPERARASAEKLARHGAIIKVLLIDPTPEGDRLARAIYINGEVETVTTAADLRRSVAASAGREADLAREAKGGAAVLDDEEGGGDGEDRGDRETRFGLRLRELVRDERLGFTAGTAAVLSPGHWESLFVCLHLSGLSNEVAELLRKRIARSQAHPTISNGYGPPTLSKGAVLRLTPRADDLEFNPAMQEVVWNEDIQTHEFRYRARSQAAGKPVTGVVEIHVLLEDVQPALVGLLGFSVQVRGPGVPVEPSDGEVHAQASMTFDTVFASHASKDKALVQACVASYQALGIHVHIDSESLRASSGDLWWPLLQGLIRQSDLFMLYWSKHAKASEVVRAEWQYALNVATSKGDRFVRPVVWEADHPAPPAELAHLHFGRLDVGALGKVL